MLGSWGRGLKRMITAMRWNNILFLDGCGLFRKTGDIHNMAETIFITLLVLLVHFYMLCVCFTMDYCLICFLLRVCSLLYKNMFSLYALFRVGLAKVFFLTCRIVKFVVLSFIFHCPKMTIDHFTLRRKKYAATLTRTQSR